MPLRDFQDRTCSWLMAEPAGERATTLWFGSAVRHSEGAVVTALMPFRRWSSRRLLAGAVGLFERDSGQSSFCSRA